MLKVKKKKEKDVSRTLCFFFFLVIWFGAFRSIDCNSFFPSPSPNILLYVVLTTKPKIESVPGLHIYVVAIIAVRGT